MSGSVSTQTLPANQGSHDDTGLPYSASLVCRSWREPAQRALHALVYLLSRAQVARYKQAFIGPQAICDGKNVRYLDVSSFVGPSEAYSQFRDIPASTIAATMVNLRELHAGAVLGIEDAEMALLLAGLPSLQVLTIKDSPDDPYTYGTKALPLTIAQIPTALPNLQYLWLEGLHAHALPKQIYGHASQIRAIALINCNFSPALMSSILVNALTR